LGFRFRFEIVWGKNTSKKGLVPKKGACITVEARKNFVSRQPMGRLAQAHEIAPIVVYLASDESQFATGQVFSIDGGMTI
jgi:NAD(P)-dependent dehydrogenase (short-subunit alcohol dehydrogenase family)